MATGNTSGSARTTRRAAQLLASAALSLLAGACAQVGTTAPQLAAALQGADSAKPATTTPAPAQAGGKSELVKATQYWGEAYAKNPGDAQAAYNYARNLKALGEKRQALTVLQQASTAAGNHRGYNGEYGRLALEFDQISLAQKLLEQAEDPANPDWRIVSAKGTVLAKQGRYREAIALYERALTLAPEQPSLLNNLALAHAMEGEIDKAEPLLRRAVGTAGGEARVNQNLALVLGLQGKYDEAKVTAAHSLPADKAAANVDFVRSIVQLDAKPMTTGSLPAPQKDAAPAPRTKQAAELKPAAAAAADEVPASSHTNWATVVTTAKARR
jgi:Flp pilus assembly protein TadD